MGAVKPTWQNTVINLLTALFAMIWLLPLIFGILMSFRPAREPINIGNIFFGSEITLQNYNDALQVAPWGMHYVNSIIFVAGVLVVQLITVTLAGYAFARMRFWGRNLLLFIILLQILIPPAVLIVQNFSIIRQLKLFDTH